MSALDEESAPLVGESAAGARDDRCGVRRRARAAAAALVVFGALGAVASSVGSRENALSLGAPSAKPPDAPRTCAPVTHLRESPCSRAMDRALGEPRARLEAYAACTAGGGALADVSSDRPYVVPDVRESRARYDPRGSDADGASGASADGSRNAPRAFAFVHIPKSGGSTLTTRWTFLARQSDACVDREASPALHAGSFELDPEHEFFPARCVVDASTDRFLAAAVPALGGETFSGRAGRAIAAGTGSGTGTGTGTGTVASRPDSRRLWIKGEFAMGTCDLVDAPCAYVTAIREPVERLLSHWRYICLLGAENQEGWPQEWKDAGRCPLDAVSFWERGRDFPWGAENAQGHPESLVARIAPGGDPGSTCALEAAKQNLAARCVRYLMLDRMDDGVERLANVTIGRSVAEAISPGAEDAAAADVPMSDALSDALSRPFAFSATILGKRWLRVASRRSGPGFRVNAAADVPMSEENEARWEEANAPETRRRLEALVPNSVALYAFAKERYEKQWDEPFEGC